MFLCPRCDEGFADIPTRDGHLDKCESSKTVIASEATMQSVQTLRGDLTSYTSNRVTADYLVNVACPIALALDDGSMMAILGTPNMAERLRGRRIVDATMIKESGPILRNPIHLPLSQVLLTHQYGRIVLDNISLYKALDDKTCSKSFKTHYSKIAKKLAGSLLHSLTNVLLVLKVEVNGRKGSEDAHQQPLAFPVLEPYTVQLVEHDHTTKILIGTNSWLALVTSSIQLNTGTVIAGPHNTNFAPHARTSVYIRSDYRKNVVEERHLRSKFHLSETYLECAGIFHLFQHHTCLPFTVSLLYDHFLPKGPSGLKIVAAIFYKLHQERNISQTHLSNLLKDTTADSSRILRDVRDLQQMLKKNDDDLVEVTVVISQQLRILCDHTVSTITNLNHTVVKNEIEKRIEAILNARI